jgi:hypothetical protein
MLLILVGVGSDNIEEAASKDEHWAAAVAAELDCADESLCRGGRAGRLVLRNERQRLEDVPRLGIISL